MDYSTTAKKSEKLRIEPVFVSGVDKLNDDFTENTDERFRIILFSKGTFISQINGKSVRIISPGIVCLNENDHIKIDIGTELEYRTFYFSPRFLNKKLNFQNIRESGMDAESEVIENRMILKTFLNNEKSGYFRYLSPENHNKINHLLDSCQEQLEKQETGWWPCKTRSYLTELLFFLVQIYESSSTEQNSEAAVSQDFKAVLEYINRLYNTKITLESLCAEFGTNRTSLNKRFNEETGMSAIAYVINLRLRIAFSMLQDTDLPVNEISDRTGFSDSTHFERLFKKNYKMLPADVRKKK